MNTIMLMSLPVFIIIQINELYMDPVRHHVVPVATTPERVTPAENIAQAELLECAVEGIFSESNNNPEFIAFPIKTSHTTLISACAKNLPMGEGILFSRSLSQLNINKLIVLSKLLWEEAPLSFREKCRDTIQNCSAITVDTLLSLIDVDSDDFELDVLIFLVNELEGISAEEQTALVEQSKVLFTDKMNFTARFSFILVLTKLHTCLRGPWIAFWQKMSVKERISAFSYLRTDNKNEFNNLCVPDIHIAITESLPLMTSEKSISDNWAVITLILSVPAKERSSIVRQTLKLHGNNMDDVSSTINALLAVPPKERESVTEYVFLLDDLKNTSEFQYIIHEIMEVNPHERKIIVDQISWLMGKTSNSDYLIKTLRGIVPTSRELLVNYAKAYITDHQAWSSYSVEDLIGKMNKLNLDSLGTLVQKTSHLMFDHMHSYEINDTLKTLIDIPQEDLNSVVEHTIQLIGSAWQKYEGIHQLIQKIAEISAERRDYVIKEVAPLIVGQTNAYQISDVLEDFANRSHRIGS
ncbi:MAG: hypothetical protein Q8K75_06845 [Chlamydiales bacterium]|nr:hypothetical protein [Chlamydiales bacterium]